MDRPVGKDAKQTVREHLQSVYQQTGECPPELLNEPEVPEVLQYLVRWFRELSACRGSNGMGFPNPISYTEIKAWADLTGHQDIEDWEVEVIKDLDRLLLKQYAENQRNQ